MLAFVERLRRVLRVPVVTRDERLTSVAADERLAEAGVKRRDRKARIDQAAAALILQEYLDERGVRRARRWTRAARLTRPLHPGAPPRTAAPGRARVVAGLAAALALLGRRLGSPGGTRPPARRSPTALPPCAWSSPRARARRRSGASSRPSASCATRSSSARWPARGEWARGSRPASTRSRGPLSLEGILDALARGDVVRRDLTVPEGRSLDEVAALVAGEGLDLEAFLEAAHDPAPVRDLDPAATDLEGYLFPDTYDVPQAPEAPRALVRRMAQRFREVIAPELARIAGKGLTVRQVVTLASIVELETASADERPRIAARVPEPAREGHAPADGPHRSSTRSRRRAAGTATSAGATSTVDSPYNTYRRPGLPPGPIGSPGREAILAVLEPAETKELYFVSRNDGTHEFSETLAAHNRAVDRYQRRRASS